MLPPLHSSLWSSNTCLLIPSPCPDDAKKKPKWNFLFFKKKTNTDKQAIMTKSESVLLLQKHVALTGGGKK
jgi:hypothetical protein